MKANTLTPELLHKMDAVTLDGYAASHRAAREFSEHPLEQDHRAIKSASGRCCDSRIVLGLQNLNFAPEPAQRA